MTQYAYVSEEEVRHVCRALGLSDWTKLKGAVPAEDAEKIAAIVGDEASLVGTEEFRRGLEVELEHGLALPEANVTSNHPILTGRIVLAHLKEGSDYYGRLRCMELEMELAGAIETGAIDRVRTKFQALSKARSELEDRIRDAHRDADGGLAHNH